MNKANGIKVELESIVRQQGQTSKPDLQICDQKSKKMSYTYDKMKTAFHTPVCTDCNLTFSSKDPMDIHMKKVHGETPYMRLDRITKTIKFFRWKKETLKEELLMKKLC